MPYFIYRIKPFNIFEKLSAFDTFNEASTQAKEMSLKEDKASLEKIKVIFADDELHAVDLLSQVREAGPKGDDWVIKTAEIPICADRSMDENAYHAHRSQINTIPCVFSKAILAGCAQCELSTKRSLAEREIMSLNCLL